MKKIELLSPVGDQETLYYAIHAGCDAVYLSGTNYGARKYAPNFTIEELGQAVKYCHLYGVKIYVTVNTLIYESEVDQLINYVRKLKEINVDALIMQDLGMIKLVNEIFPNIEIHASTQCHNHNEEQLKLLEELNVKRAVLSREMSLEEISNLKTPLEKEIFIHGALCVSYSGQCLFSSRFLNRSGNRGECAGMCRLPYDLYKNNIKVNTQGNYLLSPKELCTVENLKQILEKDITSLKIEGRMKKKEYVYYVTKIYRTLIDKYYNNEELKIDKQDIETLKKLYNRDFTKGYLNNNTNTEFINIKSPKHQGIIIGEVLETNKKIKIKLEKELNQNDGLRFSNNKGMIANYIYNEKGLLINHAKKREIIYLDNKINLREKGKVLKTQDDQLIKDLKNIEEKKINIKYQVIARKNKPLQITILDETNKITKISSSVEQSKNNPTKKQDITEKLSKLAGTPFKIQEITYEIDQDIFIPLKNINEIRRELVQELIKRRENQPQKEQKEQSEQLKTTDIQTTHNISFLVRNEEQLKTLLTENVNIYTEDELLYKKYKNENIYLRTPRVNKKPKTYQNENLLVSETGALHKNKNQNKIISDIYLNVTNEKTVNLLENLNVTTIGLSEEIPEDELKKLTQKYQEKYKRTSNLEILVYGTLELMIMKYCPLNTLINKDKKPCTICKQKDTYTLKDRNNKHLKIINNNCITTIMDCEKIDNINKIKKYQELQITNFRIDLLDETPNEIKQILYKVKNMI